MPSIRIAIIIMLSPSYYIVTVFTMLSMLHPCYQSYNYHCYSYIITVLAYVIIVITVLSMLKYAVNIVVKVILLYIHCHPVIYRLNTLIRDV